MEGFVPFILFLSAVPHRTNQTLDSNYRSVSHCRGDNRHPRSSSDSHYLRWVPFRMDHDSSTDINTYFDGVFRDGSGHENTLLVTGMTNDPQNLPEADYANQCIFSWISIDSTRPNPNHPAVTPSTLASISTVSTRGIIPWTSMLATV